MGEGAAEDAAAETGIVVRITRVKAKLSHDAVKATIVCTLSIVVSCSHGFAKVLVEHRNSLRGANN